MKVLLILLSAAVHALAFPPWTYSYVAFVAIVPFLVVLRRLRPWQAALAGHLWGSAAIWGVGYWVADALTFYYEQPWWFGILFCLVGCQILWGTYYGLFAYVAARTMPRIAPAVRPLATSALWVACELGRARLLTGEPWMLLGYALIPHPTLIQAADIGGVYLLSFAVMLVNATIAEILLAEHQRRRLLLRTAAAPAVLLFSLLAYGEYRMRHMPAGEQDLRVTIIQGNNDLGIQWREEFYGAGLDLYARMSRSAAQQFKPDLLVWPESALTFFLAREPGYLASIASVLRPIGADLVVGAPHEEDSGARFYNSAFYVTADGRLSSRYDKNHLLPFAEYFPMRFIGLLRRNFERVRYFTPGDGHTLLQTRVGPAAVVICFEAIFPEIVRNQTSAGAKILFNLSNDVWLGRGVGQAQHLAMVVLRAVENRLWIVRATTTGMSAIIDPVGRIRTQSALNTAAVLNGTIESLDVGTFYKRFGDIFAYACVLATLAFIVSIWRKRSVTPAHDEDIPGSFSNNPSMLGFVPASRSGFALPAMGCPHPDAGLPAANGRPALRLYFIKPSRYDDEGFVLLYRWGVIPNNTLIVLAGLAADYARTHPDIDVQTVLWDEMVDGLVSPDVIDSIVTAAQVDGVELLVGLAGVQTNQYPRGRDLALQFKARGLAVVMGGFHVSSHAPTRDFLADCNVSVVIGEADQTFPRLVDDFRRGALEPTYRVTDGIRAKTGLADITVPHIESVPLPAIDDRYVTRFFNPTFSTLDTSRGCPFTCSYCSVKNVMGRTMRSRDAARVIEWVRDAYDRHGIRNLLVVDDDFFRSPEWEPILSGVAALRTTRPDLALVLQTDIEAAAYAIPVAGESEGLRHRRSRRFVDLAAAAGCFEVFMGFESFNPANLEQMQKFHNEDRQDRRRAAQQLDSALERVTARYRRVVAAWHEAGVGVHCGYIIGLPFDQPGCGKAAARSLADIGVDIASFFVHTPFPGTEDYERAFAEDRLTTDDFNLYDSTHCVQRHPCMTPAQIEREYADAYRHFYTWRRVAWSAATFHGVPGLTAATRSGMLTQQFYFTYASRRRMHPMIGGIGRLRSNEGRRHVVSDADAARVYLRQRE